MSKFVRFARFTPCAALAATVLLAAPAAVQAQTKGAVAVGATVSYTQPSADELESGVSVGPTFRTLPVQGWGLAFAFNWYGADVTDPAVGTPNKLGRLASRPLMFGIGYTVLRGRTSISPSIVAGPAFNVLSIADDQRGSFSVEGSSFERRIGQVSLAVRPSLSVTYAVKPRFGLTGSINYIINRPEFTLNTPTGRIDTSWRADAFSIGGGVVVSLF